MYFSMKSLRFQASVNLEIIQKAVLPQAEVSCVHMEVSPLENLSGTPSNETHFVFPTAALPGLLFRRAIDNEP